jgi:transcriptional regulator with XRE-family HTH domain
MTRNVNRKIIDKWIDENAPDGLSQLAVRSRVSATTISSVRRGLIPKKEITRSKLSRALGVSEDALFPPVGADEEKAS